MSSERKVELAGRARSAFGLKRALAALGPLRSTSHNHQSALLLADAHPDAVAASIRRLCDERGVARLTVDAVKVTHHGSTKNTSEALVKPIDSPRWLISNEWRQVQTPGQGMHGAHSEARQATGAVVQLPESPHQAMAQCLAQQKHMYRAVVRPTAALSLVVQL